LSEAKLANDLDRDFFDLVEECLDIDSSITDNLSVINALILRVFFSLLMLNGLLMV